jgi:hypothetical protein
LKGVAAGERDLAKAMASRVGAAVDDLAPLVLAAVVVAAERAAVLHWFRQTAKQSQLVDVVRAAQDMAIRGTSVIAS